MSYFEQCFGIILYKLKVLFVVLVWPCVLHGTEANIKLAVCTLFAQIEIRVVCEPIPGANDGKLLAIITFDILVDFREWLLFFWFAVEVLLEHLCNQLI
jgi:hypothetical protein